MDLKIQFKIIYYLPNELLNIIHITGNVHIARSMYNTKRTNKF